MFKKDDKVKVIKGIKAFEGLTGTVLDTNGSQVKVKLNMSEDAEVQKNIINIFEDYQLELESLDLLKEEAEATFDNEEEDEDRPEPTEEAKKELAKYKQMVQDAVKSRKPVKCGSFKVYFKDIDSYNPEIEYEGTVWYENGYKQDWDTPEWDCYDDTTYSMEIDFEEFIDITWRHTSSWTGPLDCLKEANIYEDPDSEDEFNPEEILYVLNHLDDEAYDRLDKKLQEVYDEDHERDYYDYYDESLNSLKEDVEVTFDNDENEKQVCCICGEEYTGYGNNAEPYKEGRCCDKCNRKFVIPSRLNKLRSAKSESLKLTESDNEKYVIIKPFTGNYYNAKNGIYVADLNKATTYDNREEALRVADSLRTRHESSRRRINSQGGNDTGKLYLRVVKRKFNDKNTTNESLKLTEEELKAWCSDNDANYYTQDIKDDKVIIRGLNEDLAEYDFKTKELKVFDYSGTTTQEQDLEDDYDDNYIRDYVYDVDMLDDKEYPSWEFVSVIATAENISDDSVIEEAHNRGFKVFIIQASNYEKVVVAAEKITEDDIMEDFASYLEGNPKVTEIV